MKKPKFSYDNLVVAMLVVNGVLLTVEFHLGIQTYVKPVMLLLAIAVTIRAVYFKDKAAQIKTLIGLSLLGSEIYLLALPFLLLPKFLVQFEFFRKGNKLSVINLIFFLYAILLLIISQLIEFSFFTILFWTLTFGFLFPLFIFYSGRRYDTEEARDILDFVVKIITIQMFIMVLQAPIHQEFRPGDNWTGSSGNAIVPGFYFCILLLSIFVQYFVKLDRPINFMSIFSLKNILWLIVLAPFLYFNDSKVIIICFVVAAILYFFLLLLLRFLSTFRPVLFAKTIFALVAIVFMFIGTYFVANYYIKLTMGTGQGVETLRYYVNPQANTAGEVGKFLLYQRVYSDMRERYPMQWTFGVGPGKFGSRTSNLMGYDVLYKVESQDKLPEVIKPYSHPLMQEYMSDLWTKEIVARNRYRSATLSMPFAGMITLKAEYGIAGVIFYLFVIYSFSYLLIQKAFTIGDWKIKNWAIALSITWFSFPFHMIFDNYQEKNYFMIPLLLLTAVVYSLRGEPSGVDKKESERPA